MELSVNSFLQSGKYRIIRYIGSGGFGCTYEAEHVLLGKRVAIKEFFVKDFCNRDEHTCQVTVGTESKKGLVEKLRRKFIDEARALSALHHPGIVSVSDVFEENGTAYYVMDYIDGCSLSDLVRREGPLSESRALGYICQVCAALSYVHTHDRLHLDIKPGNIMIDQEGNAILIDFGVSKQYDECDGENTSTLMGRTPGYAPLEQLGNDVVKFLPATDIYAVGATLYKLLTGVTPLSATRLASGESLPPLPEGVSASTRKAVETAMCLNKMQRPQSVEAFVQLLGDPETKNSNDVAEDEATVFDASIKEPKVVKPKEVHTTENDSVSGNKNPRKWLVPVVICFFVCLGAYLFEMRQSNSFESSELVLSAPQGRINGHNYVDMGLPSGLKWATCNVGASYPEDYGSYYAWGEIQTKPEYNSLTYAYVDVNSISGNSRYDVASAQWGSSWRLPTFTEIEELQNLCKWEWITIGGHEGYRVVGPNGNSIFLPAAGYRRGSDILCQDTFCAYWSGSGTSDSYGVFPRYLGVYKDTLSFRFCSCSDGLSVRPVSQ